MNEAYSIQEVSLRLGLTQKAVRRMVASGEIDSAKTGAKYAISAEALDKYLATEKRDGTDGHKHCAENAYGLFRDLDFAATAATHKAANWADIAPWWDNPGKSAMTFVDLFCGAGGLSKGLEMAGLEGIC